ncbi:MAG: pilus assembly protein, partial [Propionibacteriaceae bacterium]|nr:pilus assembly protein [Propionibacteriaceae bacterium]
MNRAIKAAERGASTGGSVETCATASRADRRGASTGGSVRHGPDAVLGHNRGDPTRGSVSLEAMILVPLFLLALFTILHGSLWLYATSVAQAAAQDGARAGTVLGGTPGQAHDTAAAIANARPCGENWAVTTLDTGND